MYPRPRKSTSWPCPKAHDKPVCRHSSRLRNHPSRHGRPRQLLLLHSSSFPLSTVKAYINSSYVLDRTANITIQTSSKKCQ